MRVTNNMITKNSASNINSTKIGVDSKTNQMTTQKKISRPSEDPVVAVRALRFSTSLSKLNQYYKKNIPDANSWLDVTETALLNMTELIKDFRTQCVNGSTGTLTADDRNTILSQLNALQKSIYSEGDSDYAGRTVFTGFRTDDTLTFQEDSNSIYTITQKFTCDDLTECRYYDGEVDVPASQTEILTNTIGDMEKTTYDRIRLSYDSIGDLGTIQIECPQGSHNFISGLEGASYPLSSSVNGNNWDFYVYDDEADWSADKSGKKLGDYDVAIIKSTGEIIFGEKAASDLKVEQGNVQLTYDKTGFRTGELKPEFYYNCTNKTTANPISYTNFETVDDGSGNLDIQLDKPIAHSIDYNVAANQTLGINIEGKDVFDSNIIQDINDMITAVNSAQNAHKKMDEIKSMMGLEQYATEQYQTKLQEWYDAAQKEADFYDDNLQKMFDKNIASADKYLNSIALSVTNLGCKADQLEITNKRVGNQIETVTELQSNNEDVDLSQIIIDYTTAYTAYQASLTAAGKLGEISLLNYI